MRESLPFFSKQKAPARNASHSEAGGESRKQQKGFTLVEVLVAAAIISIAGAAILTTIASMLKVTLVSQDTVRAQNLANEKMEVLKNMPYNSLATQHGAIYPPGNILDSETVTSGGHTYVVHTYISYVDDPFDGNALGTIPGKPKDIYPFDYKKVAIEVRDKEDSKVLTKISTNVSANAAETSNGTGILFLKVIDSQNDPVPNANVHLTNPTKTPAVDIVTITDTEGLLQIPILPEDKNNGYHLEVSFPGFSSDQTYPDNRAGYDPVQPDFNIIAQQVTNMTLSIDLLSTFNITVVNEAGAPVPNLDVKVTGDKLIYVDTTEVNPAIPKYSQTFTTNAGGLITISNLEWDSHSLSTSAGYFIISTSPYQKVSVPAGVATAATLKVTTDSSWPRITKVIPISGLNNGPVTVEVSGANLPVGSGMQLQKSGQSTIVATGVVSSDSNTKLTGTFDLTSVATGVWDLIVTGSGGKSTTQSGGFTISAP